MLVKKITSDPKKSGFSLWARCRNLTAYILNPAGKPDPETGEITNEKCTHWGTRNLTCPEAGPLAISAEIYAMSRMSRSLDCTDHHVLSVPRDELLTVDQVEEMVDLALKHFGLTRCLCVYARHEDTDNAHVHLYVSRFDPVEGKTLKINRGWTRNARQGLAAIIEAKQNRAPEPNATFKAIVEINEKGEETIVAVPVNAYDPNAPAVPAKLPQHIADGENRAGVESDVRFVQRIAFSVLNESESWSEIHEKLAPLGLFIRQPPGMKNSGLIAISDGHSNEAGHVKLSDVSRKLSMGQLQKRLGQFEQPTPALVELALNTKPPEKIVFDPQTAKKRREAKRDEDLARYKQQRKQFAHDEKLIYLSLRKAIIEEPREKLSIEKVWIGRPRPMRFDNLLTREQLEIQRSIEQLCELLCELLDAIFRPRAQARSPAQLASQEAYDSKADRLLELQLARALRPKFPKFKDWQRGKPPRATDLPRDLQNAIRTALDMEHVPEYRVIARQALEQVKQHYLQVADAREERKKRMRDEDAELFQAREQAEAIRNPAKRKKSLAEITAKERKLREGRMSPEVQAERLKARLERLDDLAYLDHAAATRAADTAPAAKPTAITDPRTSAPTQLAGPTPNQAAPVDATAFKPTPRPMVNKSVTQPVAPEKQTAQADSPPVMSGPAAPPTTPMPPANQQAPLPPTPDLRQPQPQPLTVSVTKIPEPAPTESTEAFRNRLEQIAATEKWAADEIERIAREKSAPEIAPPTSAPPLAWTKAELASLAAAEAAERERHARDAQDAQYLAKGGDQEMIDDLISDLNRQYEISDQDMVDDLITDLIEGQRDSKWREISAHRLDMDDDIKTLTSAHLRNPVDQQQLAAFVRDDRMIIVDETRRADGQHDVHILKLNHRGFAMSLISTGAISPRTLERLPAKPTQQRTITGPTHTPKHRR